jgi:hypothetical protein
MIVFIHSHIEVEGGKFRFLVKQDHRVIRTKGLSDHCRLKTPYGRNRGNHAPSIGIGYIVFVDIDIVVILDPKERSNLSDVPVIERGYQDFNLLCAVEVLVEEIESAIPVRGAREDFHEITQTSPGSQMSGGGPAIEIEIGLSDHLFRSPENVLKVLKGGPFIFMKKEIVRGGVTISGVRKSIEKEVVMSQLVMDISRDDFDIAVADAKDGSHRSFSYSQSPKWGL